MKGLIIRLGGLVYCVPSSLGYSNLRKVCLNEQYLFIYCTKCVFRMNVIGYSNIWLQPFCPIVAVAYRYTTILSYLRIRTTEGPTSKVPTRARCGSRKAPRCGAEPGERRRNPCPYVGFNWDYAPPPEKNCQKNQRKLKWSHLQCRQGFWYRHYCYTYMGLAGRF